MTAPISRRLPLLFVAAPALLLACCAAKGWGGSDLLCLLPALLIGCTLLARRYPGERLLIAARPSRKTRWPHARSSVRRLAPLTTTVVRGGLLIASSLAVRPPPRTFGAS